jgi:hypothetical protein
MKRDNAGWLMTTDAREKPRQKKSKLTNEQRTMMMSATRQVTWANHQGQVYQVLDSNATHALILHPSSTGIGMVNVALNGPPVMVPGMVWAAKEQCHFYPEPRLEPLPPIPFSGGLQVGSRVRWGTSLGEWSVVALVGRNATIRQVSGWAQAIPFDAPVDELRLLDGGVIERAAA